MNKIREAIMKETERRDWNLLRLAKESGVPYGSVHTFFNSDKEITTATLEKLMDVLKLKISKER